jgi:predicted membrane-bound spermidine synthase
MIGLFMFGLSMGVYLSNRLLILKKDIRSLPFLAGSELIILFIIISQLLLIVFGLYSSKIVYLLFILLCGVGTGLQYPFINRVLIEGGMPVGKTAGLIDSMDHLGAFLGALVTNILLVPILGITATLAALLIMKAAGTVSLIFSEK